MVKQIKTRNVNSAGFRDCATFVLYFNGANLWKYKDDADHVDCGMFAVSRGLNTISVHDSIYSAVLDMAQRINGSVNMPNKQVSRAIVLAMEEFEYIKHPYSDKLMDDIRDQIQEYLWLNSDK